MWNEYRKQTVKRAIVILTGLCRSSGKMVVSCPCIGAQVKPASSRAAHSRPRRSSGRKELEREVRIQRRILWRIRIDCHPMTYK
ncbi:hypothetical protein GBA52_009388 [Prunus armeniaca]|nr:hypothetical protein GBA52_009388 [Prunus armeniaca]